MKFLVFSEHCHDSIVIATLDAERGECLLQVFVAHHMIDSDTVLSTVYFVYCLKNDLVLSLIARVLIFVLTKKKQNPQIDVPWRKFRQL